MNPAAAGQQDGLWTVISHGVQTFEATNRALADRRVKLR